MNKDDLNEFIDDLIDIIQTPEFPRNVNKQFLLSWLRILKRKVNKK